MECSKKNKDQPKGPVVVEAQARNKGFHIDESVFISTREQAEGVREAIRKIKQEEEK